MRNKNAINYDLEFKQSSAKLALESEQSISETARNLGINPNTLHGWIKKIWRASAKTHCYDRYSKITPRIVTAS
jgi:transposase